SHGIVSQNPRQADPRRPEEVTIKIPFPPIRRLPPGTGLEEARSGCPRRRWLSPFEYPGPFQSRHPKPVRCGDATPGWDEPMAPLRRSLINATVSPPARLCGSGSENLAQAISLEYMF